jgi:hypothetical protein
VLWALRSIYYRIFNLLSLTLYFNFIDSVSVHSADFFLLFRAGSKKNAVLTKK